MGWCVLRKGGQIFSLDVLFALGIFLVLLLLSFSLSQLAQERAKASAQTAEMEMKAQFAMDSLLLTAGNPGDWYANASVSSLGLTTEGDYILDLNKVQALVALNSSWVNTSAFLGITGYQSYVHIKNGSSILYSLGPNPSYTVHDLVIVERLAILQKKVVHVEVGVWQ